MQKGESQTEVRRQLEQIPVYTAWVIYLIIGLQLIAVAILCTINGIVPPRLTAQHTTVG